MCTISTRSTICGDLPCVDGFCCNSYCSGTCESCGVAGSQGTCTFQPAGTDPDNDCSPQSADTCGRTGECDGAGACEFYPAGTPCNDGQACSTGDACDGHGLCVGEVPSVCGPGAGNECCVGGCTDGVGCATSAGPCNDVCEASALTVGRGCSGCGAAGAAGTCGGGNTYRCDANEHTACQEMNCGGMRYYCTNTGGNWAWRPSGACDDGNACTYNDTCSAGVCTGNTVTCESTTCAERSCNGTPFCTEQAFPGRVCDDGNACTYNDTCNSAGQCVGGGSVSCTSTDCISRSCNGTASCSETVLNGNSCSDGNACTFGDTCNSSGVCVPQGQVECGADNTTCAEYVCDGTATCSRRARNVGGVCEGAPEDDRSVCDDKGFCIPDPGCPPPADACINGTQSRDKCSNARTINRLVAGSGSGWSITDNTCSARNRIDHPNSSVCWDANSDHTYRIYMREGEQITARYKTAQACPDEDWSTWNGTLQIFEGEGCGDSSCGNRAYCVWSKKDQTANYTAIQDGWVIIVADGSHAFGDRGTYTLTVSLSCRGGNCACQ